jgi:urea transport system permease protein
MKHNLPTFLFFGLIALLPLTASDYWVSQFNYYLVYGLFALSLSLVWGYSGILCLGQAIFFGIGAYTMAAVTKGMISPDFTSSFIGIAAAIAVSALAACLLGVFLFAGKGIEGAYLAVVTLAIAVIAERIMSNWYTMGGYNGLLDIPPLSLHSIGISYEFWDSGPLFYVLWAVVLLTTISLQWLTRSKFGVLLTALKSNPERLTFFGYTILPLKLSVFCLGAGLSGLAGALFVTLDGFVSPTLIGFTLSTEVLIWVALGGKELLLAALLGAFITRLAESTLSDIFGDYWILMLGLIFMTSVVLFPKGLIATPLTAIARRLKLNSP